MRTPEDAELKLMAFINEYSDSPNRYWLPLCGLKKDIPNVCFDIGRIFNNNDAKMLKNVFEEMNISEVHVFNMDLHEYSENEPASYMFDEGYSSEEFYFDDSCEWLVYISHEQTICFTGDKISDAARKNISGKYFCQWLDLQNGSVICDI